MKQLVTVVTWVIALAAVCRAEEVRTNPKLFHIAQSGEVVIIEGAWRNVTGGSSIEMPRANSVRVECLRNLRTCTEHIAKLIQPSENPLKQTMLFVMKVEFRVLEWSQSAIIARAQPRAADIDLRISLADRTAERTSRETGARGAEGANPTAIHLWRLE